MQLIVRLPPQHLHSTNTKMVKVDSLLKIAFELFFYYDGNHYRPHIECVHALRLATREKGPGWSLSYLERINFGDARTETPRERATKKLLPTWKE